MRISRHLLVLIGCVLSTVHTAGAQRPGSALAGPTIASDSGFVGTCEFAFVPTNGEPITGRLAITRRDGRYHGVFTSPKLSEPLEADSVVVTGAHLFTSIFGCMYTFAFDLHGTTISNAVLTKSMRGTTEQGALSIKRAP